MPRYDYQCTECNHLFELKQGFDAETVTDCPKCGKLAERQISLVPVIFKGSGWYVNDYGKKKSTLGDSSSGDSSSSNGSEGGDSAPSSGDGGHTHSHGGHSHTHEHEAPAAPAAPAAESSTSSSDK